MSYIENRRSEAIRSLPALTGALFCLHNFYDVEIEVIATRLHADERDVVLCLTEARMMINDFHLGSETRRFDPNTQGAPIARLEHRLRLEYRQALEAAFAFSGFMGSVDWPIEAADLVEDEEAAANFLVSFLPTNVKRSVDKGRKLSVSTANLWRHVPPWRRTMRDHLLQCTNELACGGWRPFDKWIADRVAEQTNYPYRFPGHQRRRRPFKEGEVCTAPRPVANRRSADEVQQRFDALPRLTQDVWVLFNTYGRNGTEIAKRLGISRSSVERRIGCTTYAILGHPVPSIASDMVFKTKALLAMCKRRCQLVWFSPRDE